MPGKTLAAIVSLGLAVGTLGCMDFYEIPVEIPIQAKLDVSMFKRVLVAGFLAGGSKSIDPNTETARLLRSQLRTKSDLKVVDADVLSLIDEMDKRTPPVIDASAASQPPAGMPKVMTLKELEPYEKIFEDKEYWKKVGEEYQSPLIVTGSILFSETTKSGMTSVLKPTTDVNGVEVYREVQEFREQKGFALDEKFVFIDGRTGDVLHTETIHNDYFFDASQNTPALSAYFELMDKVLPTFITTLNTQKIRQTRVLLK